jgi:hypothetical protein
LDEQRKPADAGRENHRKAGQHRDERQRVAPIESALGERPRYERSNRVAQKVAAGRAEQARRTLRQHRRRGKYRQTGNPEREIDDLARHAQTRTEYRAADEHDQRLQRKRHRRERQRNADLRRDGGEHDHECDGTGALAEAQSAVVAGGEIRE